MSQIYSLTREFDLTGQAGSHYLPKNVYYQKNAMDSYCHSPVIIPSPPKREGVKDHAFYLGQSLSLLSGYRFFPLLSRLDSTFGQQKQKNKTHRRQLKFQLNNYVSYFNSVIFVDDVLTTGSTAIAAKEALNPSKNFIALTIAWRHLI